METERKEQLSAMIDGQSGADTYQDVVAQDDLKECWHRYHMIGDAMRNELPPKLELDLASRVAAALENEPTVLAPKKSATADFKAKVINIGQRFGQYAVAASVAAVALIGVQKYGVEQSVAPAPVLETIPMLGAPTPASYQMPGARTTLKVREDKERKVLEQQKRANAFLRDHLLQQRLNGIVAESKKSTEEQ